MTSEAQFSGDDGKGIAASMEQVAAFVGHFSQAARAEACVGPDRTANGHTVIPIASVSVQAGFGLGYGSGSRADQGQGCGGGGRGASRMIALVDVSESGVNVRPVPDVTTISLALMALNGFDWPGFDHKKGREWVREEVAALPQAGSAVDHRQSRSSRRHVLSTSLAPRTTLTKVPTIQRWCHIPGERSAPSFIQTQVELA